MTDDDREEVRRIAREAVTERRLEDDWIGAAGVEAHEVLAALIKVLADMLGPDFSNRMAEAIQSAIENLRSSKLDEDQQALAALDDSELRRLLDD